MMKWVILLLLFVLRCEQSTIVFDPVTNKAATASTAPTQGTVTVNVDLSVLVNAPYNKLLNNQVFTVSVYGATGLVAGIVDDGTGTTSATGTASVILKASDVSNCITATDATLPNGTYYYYFSINYNGQARTVANTDSAANGTGLGCGANGFIQSSTGGNMYASRGTISVKPVCGRLKMPPSGPMTLLADTATSTPAAARVIVEVKRLISPSNTITPNGDGVNDTWEILGIRDYPSCQVYIYDRWGQKVFSSVGYKEPFDGTHNGSPLPVATYYWIINPKNGRQQMNGSVTIIR